MPPRPAVAPFASGLAVVLAAVLLHAPGRATRAADNTPAAQQLASFSLPDQFGTNHSVVFPGPKPVLLLVGDRRGSEEIDAWIPPLKERWSGVAEIAGIGDVSAAPRFLRSRITDALRKERPKPLMLDFEGRVTDPLRCTPRTANLLVLDREGRVLLRLTGTPSPEKLQRVQACLGTAGSSPGTNAVAR